MAEESLEQLFAEVAGKLVLLEETEIPRIAAKVHDLREECSKAYEALSRLEARVLKQG